MCGQFARDVEYTLDNLSVMAVTCPEANSSAVGWRGLFAGHGAGSSPWEADPPALSHGGCLSHSEPIVAIQIQRSLQRSTPADALAEDRSPLSGPEVSGWAGRYRTTRQEAGTR